MRIEHVHKIVVSFEPLEVNHNLHELQDDALRKIQATLDVILERVTATQQTGEAMKAELDALQTQVQENENLEQSAVTLIQGIADMIAQAAGDKARVLELTASLKATAEPLAAALKANTPADNA